MQSTRMPNGGVLARRGRARAARFGLLLGMCVFVGLPRAQAAPPVVYRWVDPVDRQVHYSDSKPQDAAYEVVPVDRSPPRDPEAERRLEAIDIEAKRWASVQMRELEIQQREEADAAARALDCARASSQLGNLSMRPGPRLRLIESDGTARRMTEEERQDRHRGC